MWEEVVGKCDDSNRYSISHIKTNQHHRTLTSTKSWLIRADAVAEGHARLPYY
jgi:hypothetical protein